jgi:hypothetical protein
MAKTLIKDKPYERFSRSLLTGFAPGVTVTLHMPVSGRKIAGKRALIDTGAEITWIYPRDVTIDLSSDVDYDPGTGELLVGVEIDGQNYHVQCGYQDHPYAGMEQVIIGMNLLSNWLVELHGRRRLLSVTHLEPDE